MGSHWSLFTTRWVGLIPNAFNYFLKNLLLELESRQHCQLQRRLDDVIKKKKKALCFLACFKTRYELALLISWIHCKIYDFSVKPLTFLVSRMINVWVFRFIMSGICKTSRLLILKTCKIMYSTGSAMQIQWFSCLCMDILLYFSGRNWILKWIL